MRHGLLGHQPAEVTALQEKKKEIRKKKSHTKNPSQQPVSFLSFQYDFCEANPSLDSHWDAGLPFQAVYGMAVLALLCVVFVLLQLHHGITFCCHRSLHLGAGRGRDGDCRLIMFIAFIPLWYVKQLSTAASVSVKQY